jgi:flagellar biosynthesis protein FliR
MRKSLYGAVWWIFRKPAVALVFRNVPLSRCSMQLKLAVSTRLDVSHNLLEKLGSKIIFEENMVILLYLHTKTWVLVYLMHSFGRLPSSVMMLVRGGLCML